MKQTEWVNTATKAKPSKENRPHPIQVENQFEILEVEDDINESESTAPESNVQTTHDQILEYRSKARSKFTSQKNKQTKTQCKQSKSTTEPASKKHEGKPEKQDKRTLVIGDSMVKNIDQQKIQRAAGDQSVVHSYSGAKVDQIMTKIKNGIMKDQFETVILHVGTNDLVHKDPELVATKMDRLITETKSKARKVAVSSVVKRYDGRVAASSITHVNNLASNLCSQHNIVFLNNDHINKSLLNRSDLHLNQSGDRALGSVFCTYLKSNRVKINNRPVNTRDEQVFPNAYRNCRKREWTTYLQFVNKISNNAGSDFLTSLNSVPSTRGFKMAFLNIVSLPKNLDEIRYSMSSKHIDLIAFNETRLDSNLNNNMVHINNYDIIRKDRSRSGGGVCI